jgi:CDP-diacylglycerol--serine O-phosphatidyltransferase
MFGIKDLFTTINLLGGIVGICLCIDGQPYWAGVSVMLGYLCGDTLDGYVARKLGTSNEFGSEFDTIADHLSHVIAPAAIVYTVYKDVGLLPAPWSQVLAIALAASLIIAVSIRHARNIVAPVKYKGVWSGLPRSVLGFMAIGYCNAQLAPHAFGGWWLGVVLIPAMAVATLTYLPFPSHHITRSHYWYVNAVIILTFVLTIGIWVVYPRFGFDVLFFFMAGYSLSAWMSLSPAEREDYRRAVAQAKLRARAQRPANRARVARELHEKRDEERERAGAVGEEDPVEVTS